MSRFLQHFGPTGWPFSALRKNYKSIPASEQNNTNTTHENLFKPRSQQQKNIRKVIIAILFIALLTTTTMYMHLLNKTLPPRRQDCGHSISEALALNCSFDELSKAWLPSVCPKYGALEYVSAGISLHESGNSSGWRYYANQEGTIEYTLEEVADLASGNKLYWTTRREHAYHCMWMMNRMAYVFENGGRRDQLLQRFDHARHCLKVLLKMAMESDEEGLGEIEVKGDVGFGHC